MNKLTLVFEFIGVSLMFVLIIYGLPLYALAFGITE